MSSIVAISIYISTSSARGFPIITPSLALVCGFFDDGHSEWYEMIPRCCF